MKFKQFVCMFFLCLLMVGNLSGVAEATVLQEDVSNEYVLNLIITRATGSFNISIPARSKMIADTNFPMEAGETIRINASYSPDGSVDFGLLDADGVFHFINTTNGSINETIEINERGNYRLQIRNNSSNTVKVSGFVNY